MVDSSSSVGSTPPSPQGPKPPEKKAVYKPGDVYSKGYPDPFPGMKMTDAEKKRFWNSVIQQMNSTIQDNTKKMKEAQEKLKESEEDNI